jgi:hypothetical protein
LASFSGTSAICVDIRKKDDAMNPELWSKPYDYTFEEREVKGRFLKFFEGLTQAKRITHDPFKNTTNIRCTFQGCKLRYAVNEQLFQQIAESQPKDVFRFTAGVHEHFLHELNFNRVGSFGAATMCKNGKELYICEQCGYAPFPKPMGFSGAWEHSCGNKTWMLSLNKPNTMIWRQSAWIVQIDYVHTLWTWMNGLKGVNYDPKNSCWLVSDSVADEVEKGCRYRLQAFWRGQKPAQRTGPGGRPMATGNLNIRKVQAANDAMEIISRTGCFRAIQSRLHPDRFTDSAEKEQATKDFQALQEAWHKWEKA